MSARRSDSGSALMLVPAAVLVLLMLGAIAVDSAVVFLAQRDLANRTAAAANDIAGFSASDDAFYRNGAVVLSPQQAARYVDLTFSGDRRPPGYVGWGGRATTPTDRTVQVEAWADVSYIFAKALPGFPDTTRVRAVSVATARGG